MDQEARHRAGRGRRGERVRCVLVEMAGGESSCDTECACSVYRRGLRQDQVSMQTAALLSSPRAEAAGPQVKAAQDEEPPHRDSPLAGPSSRACSSAIQDSQLLCCSHNGPNRQLLQGVNEKSDDDWVLNDEEAQQLDLALEAESTAKTAP